MTVGIFLRALRVSQWPKNLLVATAFVGAHRVGEDATVGALILAFLAFCAAASAVYVSNDLLDAESDRLHPRKRERPFAAGEIRTGVGVAMIALLLAAAAAFASPLPTLFIAALCAYVAVASAYSLWLKRLVLVDVFVLASLYILRIVAGAFAINVAVSYWLLALSLFLFLSLALLKRFSELGVMVDSGAMPGRGYRHADQATIGTMGIASGFMAVLVFALYFSSADVGALYSRPIFLWLSLPAFLLWICRMWLLAARGELPDDPVSFALRDPVSYAMGAFIIAAVVLAAVIK